MRFSSSMINTYMSCPLQARYHYFDRLPQKQNAKASFGSCIHHALERYNQDGDLEKSVALFKDVWENPEKLGVAPDYWPRFTSFGSLMTRGEEVLRDYADKNKWEKRRILATEHKFCVPFGKHELHGFVDLVETKKSGKGVETVRIVDYKTNARSPLVGELRVNVQFSVYVYASEQKEFWVGNGPDFPGIPNGEFYWEMFKDQPRRAIWYQLMNSKEIDAGQRDQADYERLYRVLDEIEKAITKEVFVPNISGSTCMFCSYTEQCGLSIPTREQVVETEEGWF